MHLNKPVDNRTTLQRWSIAGFFIIILLGTVYHSIFNWSNQSNLLGIFFPVNESVWEHLKLAPSSVLTFSLAEFPVIRKIANNYFFAKAIGIILVIATILIVYYTYTALLTGNYLLLDIGSFIAGVLLGQLSCYKLLQSKPSKVLNRLGIIALLAIVALFAISTYYPPHLTIFRDNRTDTYGIKRESVN
jgi:hypothetical protein